MTLDKLARIMNNQFNRVDKRFDLVDKRFNSVEKRLDYQGKEIIGLDKKIDNLKIELKQDINNLHTAVDGYAKKADAYFQEMVMLAKKVDRQERWIQIIAEKVGVKLEY